ncbi:MAG: YfiT family bacillithiol transferase, partial [Bacteroidia bacterium]
MSTQFDIEKLKYPAGKFLAPGTYNAADVKKFIARMEALPADLEAVVKDLSGKELTYCYRAGSWNVKQIVHHIADSHLNFHARLRLTLTEDKPTIKPYDENLWAKLVDGNNDDLTPSLLILEGVHTRAVELLKTLNEKDFAREYHHPENKKDFSLFW